MARLAELPLKRLAQFSTDGDPALIRWHKTWISGLMRRTGIGLYGLIWLLFAKGALLAILIGRLIHRFDQEIERNHANGRSGWESQSMGITHCPLCIGLAVLSAVRFMAHLTMAFQLERQRASTSTHPALVIGTLFEL